MISTNITTAIPELTESQFEFITRATPYQCVPFLSSWHLTKFELRKSVDLGLSYGLTLNIFSAHSSHTCCLKLPAVLYTYSGGFSGVFNPPQFWKNNYADRLEPQLLK